MNESLSLSLSLGWICSAGMGLTVYVYLIGILSLLIMSFIICCGGWWGVTLDETMVHLTNYKLLINLATGGHSASVDLSTGFCADGGWAPLGKSENFTKVPNRLLTACRGAQLCRRAH